MGHYFLDTQYIVCIPIIPYYYMSKKSWPILNSNLSYKILDLQYTYNKVYKNGRDFLDIRY